MTRAKLLYAVILIGLAVFYVLYIDSLALVLLLCAILIPVLLCISLIWVHLSATSRLLCGTSTCSEDDSVAVTVMLENHSPLFFPRAEAELCISHAFGKHPEVLHLKFPVQGNNTTRLTFYLHTTSCGSVEIRLKRLWIYDMFRLFRTKVRSDHDVMMLLVLPNPIYLPVTTSAPPVDMPDSERFADRPGDDPSEIFGIREYQPGDAVSRMHWKLSSRSDVLLVKEFSLPIEKRLLVYVEYVPGRLLTDAKAMLRLVYSLCYRVLEENLLCELAWYEGTQVVTYSLDSEKTLSSAFRKLYDALFSTKSAPDTVREAFVGRMFSSATFLSNRPDTELLPVLEQHLLANQKNLLLVTAENVSLCADHTEIHMIHPDEMRLKELVI